MNRARAALCLLVIAAAGVLGAAPAASAHGGDMTIEVGSSVAGSTVTYSVHLVWEDGHDVVGQGVAVDASGPGGSRSAMLPATNASGRTSGSITLGDGTWSVTFSTDGGSRTIIQRIGADPTTAPPATAAPTAAPATQPPATQAPAVAPTPTTAAKRGATSAPGASTTVAASVAGETTVAPTTVPGSEQPAAETTSTTTVASSTTEPGSTTTEAVVRIATSGDDDGSSAGLIAGGAGVAVLAAGGALAVRMRRVRSAASAGDVAAPDA